MLHDIAERIFDPVQLFLRGDMMQAVGHRIVPTGLNTRCYVSVKLGLSKKSDPDRRSS